MGNDASMELAVVKAASRGGNSIQGVRPRLKLFARAFEIEDDRLDAVGAGEKNSTVLALTPWMIGIRSDLLDDLRSDPLDDLRPSG